MTLLRFDDVTLGFGDPPLLSHANLLLQPNERVCLVGRNGAGKSTLLKVADGTLRAQEGIIWRAPGVRIATLAQELPEAHSANVRDVVAGGLHEIVSWLAQWHDESIKPDANLDLLADLQHRIENAEGWDVDERIDNMIERLNLPAHKSMDQLSGGWRRRVMLGRALVSKPDVLLLDEPTNHLDVNTITWLEEHLLGFPGSLLFVTHDRAFLQRLATRIVELDRGTLKSWECDYHTFLERKQHELDVEVAHNALFDKRLAAEEVWIRQGIKARRTRNEGRVRALEALRRERSQRREVQGSANIRIDNAGLSGKIIAELKDVSKHYGDETVIGNFSLTLSRGDKIGLIGPNGIGKTTLLRLILGDTEPDSGMVHHGTKLDVAYFDQTREQLDLEKTVIDNVADGRERIDIAGSSRHIIGYLGDFLFSPDRCRTPVKALSGGERNRLLLAKLFSKPANVLVLDEPTNDLDADTLDLLENAVVEFPGTVLLVSHDRKFLDNVVTSTLVFEGNGVVKSFVGGFTDWLHQGGRLAPMSEEEPIKAIQEAPRAAAPEKIKKLSFKEQRELDGLPGEISALEQHITMLQTQAADPLIYMQDNRKATQLVQEIADLEARLETKIERWAKLSENQ